VTPADFDLTQFALDFAVSRIGVVAILLVLVLGLSKWLEARTGL
jgi:hypothetical protein